MFTISGVVWAPEGTQLLLNLPETDDPKDQYPEVTTEIPPDAPTPGDPTKPSTPSPATTPPVIGLA